MEENGGGFYRNPLAGDIALLLMGKACVRFFGAR